MPLMKPLSPCEQDAAQQSSPLHAASITRRHALGVFAGLGAASFVPLIGCGDSAASSASEEGQGSRGESGSGAVTSWARGGTAAMTQKASYPDPFTAALSTCALVISTTAGPCTTQNDLLREDVSEGLPGLPLRLALKIVGASCSPLANATVKIWHTNPEGSYSGQTPNNAMCLKQQAYAAQDFFRGVQSSDAEGRVFFDTCFPGWYPGRAIHIHFQVQSGTTSYRISQLFFPEDVVHEIFASHEDYKNYGQPNMPFASDNVVAAIPNAERELHVLSVMRMDDGAMLASKVVRVV